ncbi:MAG: thioredoxin family protein [Myxococcota bacterium]
MIVETTDARFQEDVLAAPGLTLLDLRGTSDGPSRAQGPVLARFAAAHPEVRVVKLDTEKHAGFAAHLGVRAVPTLLVFKDGFALAGAVGVQHDYAIGRLLRDAERRAEAIPQA